VRGTGLALLRGMNNRIIASALLLTLFAPAAYAADADGTEPAADKPRVTISLPAIRDQEKRPAILPVLYATLVGLHAYDVYSTRAGVSRGAAELNPVVAPLTGDTPAMIAMKAVSAGTTIFMAERLWHRNKSAAILTMVAANGVMAVVAAHNLQALHQIR
jgi:hypothetical protein